MKKILTAIIIALVLILAHRFDFYGFVEDLYIVKREEIAKDCSLSINDKTVSLGMSEDEVEKIFGKPSDELLSEYGFNWNIYHQNFKSYIQVGIKDGVVVGMYTNSPELFINGITAGTKKEDVNSQLGESLEGIVKENTRYLSNGSENDSNFEIYKIRGAYVTFFYDIYENNSLTSVNIIDCDVEESFTMLYAPPSDELKKSFSVQSFYVTNATRVRFGLKPYLSHEGLDELSYDHASDMAKNDYFSHISQNGDSVLQRAQNGGISFKTIGENLAMGAQNSVYMHELLMNSDGHRKNILGDFTHMGAGIEFGKNDAPYLTQNFLR